MVTVPEPEPVSPFQLLEAYNARKAEEYREAIRDINAFLHAYMGRLVLEGSIEYGKEFEFSDPLTVEIRREYTDAGWLMEWSDHHLIFKLPGKLISV